MLSDRWWDGDDTRKLATPPEYEMTSEEEARLQDQIDQERGLDAAEARRDEKITVGSEWCNGCKFWSELIAQSVGCGPVEALCLNKAAPTCGKMVSNGCALYEYGEPIDLRC